MRVEKIKECDDGVKGEKMGKRRTQKRRCGGPLAECWRRTAGRTENVRRCEGESGEIAEVRKGKVENAQNRYM